MFLYFHYRRLERVPPYRVASRSFRAWDHGRRWDSRSSRTLRSPKRQFRARGTTYSSLWTELKPASRAGARARRATPWDGPASRSIPLPGQRTLWPSTATTTPGSTPASAGTSGARFGLPQDVSTDDPALRTARWVAIDRLQGIIWGAPSFTDYGHFFEAVGKGKPTPDERLLYELSWVATPCFGCLWKTPPRTRPSSNGEGLDIDVRFRGGRASGPGGRLGLQNQCGGARALLGRFDSCALPLLQRTRVW